VERDDQAAGAVIQGGIGDGLDVARGVLLIGSAGLALAGCTSRQVRSAERASAANRSRPSSRASQACS
jgi:hypothetical protein